MFRRLPLNRNLSGQPRYLRERRLKQVKVCVQALGPRFHLQNHETTQIEPLCMYTPQLWYRWLRSTHDGGCKPETASRCQVAVFLNINERTPRAVLRYTPVSRSFSRFSRAGREDVVISCS
jgi:hypothetical protein